MHEITNPSFIMGSTAIPRLRYDRPFALYMVTVVPTEGRAPVCGRAGGCYVLATESICLLAATASLRGSI